MRPLEKAKNLGPVSAAELEAIGIRTIGQMRDYGWEEVCIRWAEAFPGAGQPERIHLCNRRH